MHLSQDIPSHTSSPSSICKCHFLPIHTRPWHRTVTGSDIMIDHSFSRGLKSKKPTTYLFVDSKHSWAGDVAPGRVLVCIFEVLGLSPSNGVKSLIKTVIRGSLWHTHVCLCACVCVWLCVSCTGKEPNGTVTLHTYFPWLQLRHTFYFPLTLPEAISRDLVSNLIFISLLSVQEALIKSLPQIHINFKPRA